MESALCLDIRVIFIVMEAAQRPTGKESTRKRRRNRTVERGEEMTLFRVSHEQRTQDRV